MLAPGRLEAEPRETEEGDTGIMEQLFLVLDSLVGLTAFGFLKPSSESQMDRFPLCRWKKQHYPYNQCWCLWRPLKLWSTTGGQDPKEGLRAVFSEAWKKI